MRLESITALVQPLTIHGSPSAEIDGIAYDSRSVRPGFLFVALPGARQDGREYIADAIRRGAAAVLSEDAHGGWGDIPHLRVADARRAMAEIACAFFDHPSRDLEMIGITGTNGKSTTSFMIRDMLRAVGKTPGLVGTIQYEIGERCIPAARTTPEAPDLQSMLDRMRRSGCSSCVMEVSSHGLAQQRVWGIDFDVGVFTNLTHDHLDYHGDMERYFAAKSLLFRGLGQMEKHAVAAINLDDEWGQRLASTNGFSADVITYGLHPNAMVQARNVELSGVGAAFDLVTPWGGAFVRLALLGAHNVQNALAAATAAGARGVEPGVVAEALSRLKSVPGRLERIPNARGLNIFVDYAHTGDALAHVLRTLREFTRGRLIAVFGCGGDRDRAKRPQMGYVASRLADYTFVTSDNPRREDPRRIMDEIAAGFGAAANFELVEDREKAIGRALFVAEEGDTIVVAGKGHENVQEFADTVIPFDDRETVCRLLDARA